MCGICGFICLSCSPKKVVPLSATSVLPYYTKVIEATRERGKDSFGTYFIRGMKYSFIKRPSYTLRALKLNFIKSNIVPNVSITNMRAEPTTERVKVKNNLTIQPFESFGYIVAHNGIISNDVSILKGSQVKKDLVCRGYKDKLIDSYAIIEKARLVKSNKDLPKLFTSIEGSFALALWFPDGRFVLARNYRDLAVVKTTIGNQEFLFFASKARYLSCFERNDFTKIVSLEPYSFLSCSPTAKGYSMGYNKIKRTLSFNKKDKLKKDKAIIICSGGLDSTTVATIACKENKEVLLLYYKYGCKAEKKEVLAVKNITKALKRKFPTIKISCKFIKQDWFKKLGGSTITDPARFKDIATGETGVETNNEWVPARNTVLIALTAALCDRYNYNKIYLGLNLEESGAFCLLDRGDNYIRMWDMKLKKPPEIKIGDGICSYALSTGDVLKGTVKKIFKRKVYSYYKLVINNEDYYVTPEHPFYTMLGFVKVKDLVPGLTVKNFVHYGSCCSTLNRFVVDKIRRIAVKNPVTVYNFECDPYHTYFLGKNGILTHNCDNTTEFYEKFNKVLDIGTVSRPVIINPLGNLVKHEIYKLAKEIGAPIQFSWSCYHDGDRACGKCGPCIMRKRAAEMNGLKDNIDYLE